MTMNMKKTGKMKMMMKRNKIFKKSYVKRADFLPFFVPDGRVFCKISNDRVPRKVAALIKNRISATTH